jgi:L-amino acid N-acyltransferase YncA
MIRPAIRDDSPEILELLSAALDVDARQHFYSTFAEMDLDEKKEADFIESIATQGFGFFHVADEGGQIRGYIHAIPHSQSKRRHVAVFGMIVKKEYRGMGIGTGLLKSMMDWARDESSVKAIQAWMVDGNPASKLYQRFGFVEVGRLPNAVLLNPSGASEDKCGNGEELFADLVSIWHGVDSN